MGGTEFRLRRDIQVHVVSVCMNESDPGARWPLGWSTREQTGKQMTTQSLLWRWMGDVERGDERMSHKGMTQMPGRAHKLKYIYTPRYYKSTVAFNVLLICTKGTSFPKLLNDRVHVMFWYKKYV